MQISIPYSSYLKGVSTAEDRGFKRSSESQYFLDPILTNRSLTGRHNPDGLPGAKGVFYPPVYEIQSFSFDRWSVFNSRIITYTRAFDFTQALSLDGARLEEDASVMNRMRSSIGQVLDRKELFLDRDRYLRIAEEGAKLTGGNVTLELEDAEWSPHPMDPALARLVMQLWQVCWQRMKWMLVKRVSWNVPRQRNNQPVEVLVANSKGCEDKSRLLNDCIAFFNQKLAPALPPQLMSIISITIGASYLHRDNWPDSACRVYLDGTPGGSPINERDVARMFDFRGWREGKGRAPEFASQDVHRYWKERLVGLLAQGKLPRFYSELIERFGENRVRADFDLVDWSTRAEFFLDYFQQAESARRYMALQYATQSLDNLRQLLEGFHKLPTDAVYLALANAIGELAACVEKLDAPLRKPEYEFLAASYKALRGFSRDEGVAQVCKRVLELLGRQTTIPEYEGTALDFWNEKNGRAELELDPLSLKLVERELEIIERASKLDEPAYSLWCQRYNVLRMGGQDELCRRLEQLLSRQLSFDDSRSTTPLELAQANGLDSVAVRIVRDTIMNLRKGSLGRLSEGQYRQVLAFYTDTYHNYYSRLEEAEQPARELLCGQTGFQGSDTLAADLLAEKNLADLWNRLFETEARSFAADSALLDDDLFMSWCMRLNNEMISDECGRAVIGMIVAKTPRDRRRKYTEEASAQRLGALEAALVHHMLDEIGVHKSVSSDDYRWWIDRYKSSVDEGESIAEDIYAMLNQVSLRDGGNNDTMAIAREKQQWRLLGDLAIRIAPRIANLTADKFGDWIEYYKNLCINDIDVAPEAIQAVRELLNRNITDETMAMLREQNVRGDVYWEAMQTLLDRQRNADANGMRDESFGLWLERMDDAERESNPIAGEILALLKKQYRLRKDDDLIFAFDYAQEHNAGIELLISLIDVEFSRLQMSAAPATLESTRRWLGHYKFLKRQGRDEMARAVAERLGKRPIIDGRYVLDLARENQVTDLQLDLIRAEKHNTLDGRSITDIATCERWLGHYVALRQQGQADEADEIARKLCETAVVEGQYILGKALANGADDLEGRLLERERTVHRAYSDAEYCERLNRLLGGTPYAQEYIALLTDPHKGEAGEVFDRFIRCLSENIDNVQESSAASLAEIYGKLIDSARSIRPDTLALVRQLAAQPVIGMVLKANQPGLARVIKDSLKAGVTLAQLSDLYPLLESRLPQLDRQAAEELATAVFDGGDGKTFRDYCPCVDGDMEALIRERVSARAQLDTVKGQSLSRAVRLFRAVSLPNNTGVELLAEMLARAEGTVDTAGLTGYARDAGTASKKVLLNALTEWMKSAVGQSAGTLNDVMGFAGELSLSRDDALCAVMFESVRSFIDHGNDCSGVTEKTYDQCAALWKAREDFDAIALPLLDSIESLSNAMLRLLEDRIKRGPVKLEGRFKRVSECRDGLEQRDFGGMLQSVSTLEELSNRATELLWLDPQSFARTAAAEPIREALGQLVRQDVEKRIEARMHAGDHTPNLSALTDMLALLNEDRFALFRTALFGDLDRQIQERSMEAFKECCEALDGQSREACDAFSKLEALLTQIGADDSGPLSVATTRWCAEFSAAVLDRDRVERARVEALLKQIHRSRCDLENLRAFCNKAYKHLLIRYEIRSDIDVFLRLCIAKTQDYQDVWTRYLALAMRLPADASIWSQGRDNDIATIVIFTYAKVEGFSDEVVSQMTLADYCAQDSRFSDLQKKQKNAALKTILQSSPKYKDPRGGLFGFFKR